MSVNDDARGATSGLMGKHRTRAKQRKTNTTSHEFILVTRRRRSDHAWSCTCGRARSKWMRSKAVAHAAWRSHVYAAKERQGRSRAENIWRTRETWTTWSELQKKELRVGQHWRCYKGGVYRIMALAIVEATMKPVVVYSLGDPARSWIRPLDEFLGNVDGAPCFVRVEGAEGNHGPDATELARLETRRVELWRRLDVLRSKFLSLNSDDQVNEDQRAALGASLHPHRPLEEE